MPWCSSIYRLGIVISVDIWFDGKTPWWLLKDPYSVLVFVTGPSLGANVASRVRAKDDKRLSWGVYWGLFVVYKAFVDSFLGWNILSYLEKFC